MMYQPQRNKLSPSIPRRFQAYTLLEVLISLFIFTILAGIATMSLKNLISSNQTLIQISIKNKVMLKATRLIKDDFAHLFKPINTTDNQNYLQGNKTSIEFSHISLACETFCPSLETITYHYQQNMLIRAVSKKSNTGENQNSTTQMKGIEHFQIEYLTQENHSFAQWPVKNDDKNTLQALRITINESIFNVIL